MASLNWKIGGKAGEGIAVTSFLMSKICQRAGLQVFEYSEYPSLIRGGHTSGQVKAGDAVSCQQKHVDLIVVMNEDTVRLHLDEFDEHTKLLVDTQDDKIDFTKYPSIKPEQLVAVPMVQISREQTGKSLASNMVALAVTCYLFGLDHSVLQQVISDFFKKKGQTVIDENVKAADAGLKFSQENLQIPNSKFQNPTASKTLFWTGAEAIGFGALSAGVQYYSAYPMTPTSNLMHFMAAAQAKFPVVVKHAEDEISAINGALGASFSGVRSMTGTAGGGFALMVEGVSLAGVTELPLVAVVGGRPGPATGLPTWTSQTDLQYVIHAGHGEFPKVVFTPGNLEESFKITHLAFLLAEKYHTQCYIISDKLLLESRMTVDASVIPTEFTNTRLSMAQDPLPEDNSFRRFIDTPEGYSPRSVPGQAHGLQLTNSYEHDEYGYATEDALMTKKMVEKRMRKLDGIIKEVPAPIVVGPAEAEITFVCWGSTRLVLEEVLRQVNQNGATRANFIHIMTAMPFHKDVFAALAGKAKKLVMVEENIGRQGELLIREQTGITFEHRINRYDGRPFYAEDIVKELENL
ncbi:MAG TPA: 2-oxoacid:acceptor oxidoreductase subunit alpha [Patescibacteria group bacterium]|nr:2-oxoacid:acceptor oxidoreductase subunit alpha [Patescibacteria group bacterium]